MSSAYLNLAEEVLDETLEPLTPVEIMERAYLMGIVPWHLHGKTQQKTLHARLSEDIARLRERSRFCRTAPGTFYLNRLRNLTPGRETVIHLAPPRRKDLLKGHALCVAGQDIVAMASLEGRIEANDFRRLLDLGNYEYRPKVEARQNKGNLVPVSSFVVVHVENQVLSYRTGKYVRLDEDASTPRSIGFGDIVSNEDNDLLYDSIFGIRENALRELIYGTGLEQELARQVRYNDTMPVHFAVLDTSSQHQSLNIVLSYEYKSHEPIQSRSLAFSDLRWVPPTFKLNDLSQYDATSRSIIEQGWISDIVTAEP